MARGNGLVERHHCTTKALAERGLILPAEAIFWYNLSPRTGQAEASLRQRAIFLYGWMHLCNTSLQSTDEKEYAFVQVGEVGVKPPNECCTSEWGKGTVISPNTRSNVSLGCMPCHVVCRERGEVKVYA